MKTTDFKQNFLSLRVRWTLAILFVGSLFLGALACFSYFQFGQMMLEEIAGNLNGGAQSVAQNLRISLTGLQKELFLSVSENQKLSEILVKSNAAYEGVTDEAFFEKMKSLDAAWSGLTFDEITRRYLNPDAKFVVGQLQSFLTLPFSEIFVTDIRGALVASTNKTTDYYQADEDWWQKSYNGGSGSVYRSEIELDESSGVTSVAIAVPVYGNGGIVGVFKGVLNKDEALAEIFRSFKGRANHMGIVRSDGVNIFSIASDRAEKLDCSRVVLDYIRRGTYRSTPLIKMPDGGRLICGFIRIGNGLLSSDYDSYVYLLKDYDDVEVLFSGLMVDLGFLWLVATALFSLVAGFLVNKFLVPFGELRKGFSCLKRGLLDCKISVKSRDEFEALADDFNAMTDELRGNMVSKNHFNEVIQNMSDILFVVNNSGVIDLINRRACEVLEYEEHELRGAPASQILAKKDRYLVSWGLKGTIDEVALRDKKISLLTKAGREVEVYLGTRCLRDAANNLVGLVCLGKDMAEVNKLMDALRRSHEESQKNKLDLEASLKELVASRDIMLSVLEDTNESRAVLEQTIKRLRETQDQLIQAEKMMSLGQIAAGVAHEINNPLFVISGEAEMMDAEKGLPSSMKESIGVIRDQVKRISDIIKRMLEFSRKREMKFEPIYIDPLLEKTIELLRYQTKLVGNVEIVRQFSAESLRVNGDVNQLTEVFLNLMINALQAMEGKGGALTIRSFSAIINTQQFKIGSSLKVGDPVVGVGIKDTGIGMNEETRKKIFDPFFTTKESGTGLGLPVCYGIIENHGGMIFAESVLGEGATFTVYLPLRKGSGEGR